MKVISRKLDKLYRSSFDKQIRKVKSTAVIGPDKRILPVSLTVSPNNENERFYYNSLLHIYRKTKHKNKNYAASVYIVVLYIRRILKQRIVLNVNKIRAIIHTDDYEPWCLSLY